MPEHRIYMSVPEHEIVNTDVVVAVFSDEEKLGEVRISRGTIDWVPRNHTHAFRIGWEAFDALMRDHGSRQEIRLR
ncbi:MAG: hypothetical protein EDR02_13100 [Actinobacteria bacterium]|nr:MAG: hypothetical protein EDR02_13100 [Actinomycetota bacterium]RIK04571.1 MAG: hypothetical protein DCC48_12725 [Acidobacteriota bacterium]